MLNPQAGGKSQMIFAGGGLAGAHHDVHVKDESAKRLAEGRLPDGA
jgi:hypothetical protein